MNKYIEYFSCRDDFYNAILGILSGDSTNDRANQIIDLFDDLPSADVQPVAHAEWIGFTRSAFLGCDYTGEPIFRDTTVWKCSHCGRNTVVRDNFCPNCGARMRGTSND